jgi:hypothetical protein
MSESSKYDVFYAARSAGPQLDGQNIFVYRSVSDPKGVVDAEFGVGAKGRSLPLDRKSR